MPFFLSVLIRAICVICGKDSQVESKTPFSLDSSRVLVVSKKAGACARAGPSLANITAIQEDRRLTLANW